MKALVGAFNQEKALVGAFSVIVQPVVEPMDHFTALPRTEAWPEGCSASTKSNDLKTSALLFAHRCYLKVKLALDFCISFSRSRGLWIIFSSITIWKGSDYLQSLAQYSFQDIPIAIPAPLNTIPGQILPSHIVVPRCHGNGRQTSQLSSKKSLNLNVFWHFYFEIIAHHAFIKQS